MRNSLPDPTRRFRAEWLAVAALMLFFGGLLVLALYREHNHLESQESERLQAQARVVNDNLIRQLEGVNNALAGVRDDLEQSGLGGTAAAAATTARLKLLSDAMPGVRTMAILDADGTIVASSRAELLGTNSSQRDFFITPRQRPDRAVLYVSAPFKSPLGPLVINIARVVTRGDAAFAGIVVATLDPDYFRVVLQSVLYAPDMRAALAHGDGRVFVNMPVKEETLGMNLAQPGSMFTRHQQSGRSASLVTGRVLSRGDDRMMAIRTLGRADLRMDKPLVAAVSRDLSAVFQPWRDQALRFGLFHAVLVLGSGCGLYFSQRRRQALDGLETAVARERQQGAERLELALRGADLGLWDLHVPSNQLIVNARERALLGYSVDEALPETAWRALVHPDDWPAIDAAIRPHLKGETAAYECEHRMRHKDGHWIWVFSRAMIVERDAKGAPLRIVGTHLDITERKRTDAELARTAEMLQLSEEQLRQMTDNLPALVSRFDTEQRFRFANRAYRDWLDVEPEALIGRSLSDVYGAQAFGQFRHHVEAALAGSREVYEREMATPHGLRHVEVTLIPQRGPDGAVHGVYGLINDFTARHEAELLRARSEERLTLALEGSGLAMFDWDIAGDRLYHSAQAAAMRGAPAVATTTSSAEMRTDVHPDDLGPMYARMKDAMTGAVPVYHAEFRIRTHEGGWLWLRARGRVVERDGPGRALRLAGTYADIDERKRADERLRRLAEFDTLTDLPNRAQFHDRLQQAMTRATRQKAMALLFLDIDHFKTVNDTLGHEAGDQLLKVFANRMRDVVRLSDTVARLGGDEFTIILEGLRDLNDAKALAHKLVAALSQPMTLAGRSLEITVSVGVAMSLVGETDDAALLARADAALYEAKRRGRNGYFCDDAQDGPLTDLHDDLDALVD